MIVHGTCTDRYAMLGAPRIACIGEWVSHVVTCLSRGSFRSALSVTPWVSYISASEPELRAILPMYVLVPVHTCVEGLLNLGV